MGKDKTMKKSFLKSLIRKLTFKKLSNFSIITEKKILPGDCLILGEDGKVRHKKNNDGFRAGFIYDPNFMRVENDILFIDTYSPFFEQWNDY